MYNGIGLDTVRGSGTNGYVQRNLSFIRKHRDKIDYKSEAEIQKLDQQMMKPANREILDHERKRKVELKCMEMHELMEEQGYPPDEITSKVSTFRKMLMDKEGVTEGTVEKDEAGRPLAKETHQLAEANEEKNLRLRDAFGLSEYYVDGSSFDPERRAKEEAAKAVALAQKKYSLVEISGSEGSSGSPSPAKVKKKTRDESKSPERNEKKKKSKKHKQDKSESKRHKSKSKHKHKKRSGEEKKKRRKRRPSSSSESESSSDDEPERVSRHVGKSKTVSHSPSSSPDLPRHSQLAQRAKSPDMRTKSRPVTARRSRSPIKKSAAVKVPSRSPQVGSRKRLASSSTSDSSSDSSRSPSPKQIRKKQRNKTNHRDSSASPMSIKQNGSKKRNISPAPVRNVRDNRSPTPRSHHSRSLSYSPANKKPRKSSPPPSTNRSWKSPARSVSRSRYRSYSHSRSRSPKEKSRKLQHAHSRSKRHSRSSSFSRSRSHSYRRYSSSESRSSSRSRSRSGSSRRDSRSPSIRRRRGSPSHLDKRRITSARKRPVSYYRPSPLTSSSESSWVSSRSRSRSRSRYRRAKRRRSWSYSSLDSLRT